LDKIKALAKLYEDSTYYILVIGLLAALFFSATFVINRAISLDGGHWYFSGALRLFYTILFLSVGFIFFKGLSYFKAVLLEYFYNFKFWTIAGIFGFGFFYAPICYAADFSPGWVVATTWQLTIIASLFVLSFFGKKVSKKVWITTFFIFIGVTLVNLNHLDLNNLKPLFLGFFPVLLAAFAYPIGNQMVWEEKRKRKEKNSNLEVLNNAFAKVFLLTLGSFPLWIVLYFLTDATVPSQGQYVSVALVALLSGVIATSLFLYIRSHANTPAKVITADATMSGEVFFALLGEMVFLDAAFPNFIGVCGIMITVTSLIILTKLK
jgi:drug/metabolite transporter (DMT)-like permease